MPPTFRNTCPTYRLNCATSWRYISERLSYLSVSSLVQTGSIGRIRRKFLMPYSPAFMLLSPRSSSCARGSPLNPSPPNQRRGLVRRLSITHLFRIFDSSLGLLPPA